MRQCLVEYGKRTYAEFGLFGTAIRFKPVQQYGSSRYSDTVQAGTAIRLKPVRLEVGLQPRIRAAHSALPKRIRWRSDSFVSTTVHLPRDCCPSAAKAGFKC
jgi:hypothetical protein